MPPGQAESAADDADRRAGATVIPGHSERLSHGAAGPPDLTVAIAPELQCSVWPRRLELRPGRESDSESAWGDSEGPATHFKPEGHTGDLPKSP